MDATSGVALASTSDTLPGQGAEPVTPALLPLAPESVEQVRHALDAAGYICDPELATAIFLALRLQRPLFLEGVTGVGKTEVARALAAVQGRPLVRLQCYEGLDLSSALYEWNYAAQLLQIRLLEAEGRLRAAGDNPGNAALRHDLFSRDYLLRRPLLQAIDYAGSPPVLLIDELDRADAEFEAFLLELLADFQVTIPELGTLRAPHPPTVIVTSNRTRDVHDALKRRCLYHWIDYPTHEKELAILRRKLPEAGEAFARRVVAFVQAIRQGDLDKPPGVAETLDWAAALHLLGTTELTPATLARTAGVLLKYKEDIERLPALMPGALRQAY